MAIDHDGRLATVCQKWTGSESDVISGLIWSHRGQSRQRVDHLHVTDSDREALVVTFYESHTEVLFIERGDLAGHRLLNFSDRVELDASVGRSQLRCKVVVDHFDAVGIRASHVVLIAVVAIASFAV